MKNGCYRDYKPEQQKKSLLFLVKCFGWDSPCTLFDLDHPHPEGRTPQGEKCSLAGHVTSCKS